MLFTQELYYENLQLLKKNKQIFINSKEKLKNDINNRTFGFLKNIFKPPIIRLNMIAQRFELLHPLTIE